MRQPLELMPEAPRARIDPASGTATATVDRACPPERLQAHTRGVPDEERARR